MIQTKNIQHDISEEILKRRYLWKDKNGKVRGS